MESLDGSAHGTEESVPDQVSVVVGTRIQYRDCSLTELRAFVAQHGVMLDSDEAERRRCINELAYQDDNPTFEPFLRLAPELREMIYDMVLAAAPGHLGSRDHPIPFVDTWLADKRLAVTQTSREVRGEALGRFYARNFFAIPVDTTALDVCRRQAYQKAILGRAIGTARLPLESMRNLVLQVRHSTVQTGFPCSYLDQCRSTLVVENAGLRDTSDCCSGCGEPSTLPGQIGQWCTGMESEMGTKMTVAALDTLLAISEPTVPGMAEGEFDRGGIDKGWGPPAFDEDGRRRWTKGSRKTAVNRGSGTGASRDRLRSVLLEWRDGGTGIPSS
ncbi:hypothetical protein LTR49_027192 [Elasticomyces elasticus]|nr:hypothetical protein LTR49_027192 [Elasticomyces elasticus]